MDNLFEKIGKQYDQASDYPMIPDRYSRLIYASKKYRLFYWVNDGIEAFTAFTNNCSYTWNISSGTSYWNFNINCIPELFTDDQKRILETITFAFEKESEISDFLVDSFVSVLK